MVPPWPKLFFSNVSLHRFLHRWFVVGHPEETGGDERGAGLRGAAGVERGGPCALSALAPAAARHLWDEASPEWGDGELGPLVHKCIVHTHTHVYTQTLESVFRESIADKTSSLRIIHVRRVW